MFATPAYAQTAGAASASGSAAMISMVAPLLLVGIVFYFLLHRPQQQRIKAHEARINAVKKGDSVVTAGGIAGKVTKVEERFVEVEIAPTVKVRVVKATLTEVTGLNSKPAND
jgi:preprotein translocase subunit YajC